MLPLLKSLKFWYQLYLFKKKIVLDLSKFKAFADDGLNTTQEIKINIGLGRKHFGKKRKCLLPAFSSPTMSSKGFFF